MSRMAPILIDDDDDEVVEVVRRPARRPTPSSVIRLDDDDDVIVEERPKKRRRAEEEEVVVIEPKEVISVDSSDEGTGPSSVPKKKKETVAMRRGARPASCLNDVDQSFTNLSAADRARVLAALFEASAGRLEKFVRSKKKETTLWALVEAANEEFSSTEVKEEEDVQARKTLPRELEDARNGNVETASALAYCRKRLCAMREKGAFDARVTAVEPVEDDDGLDGAFTCCVCMDSFNVSDVVFCGGASAHGLCRPCFRSLCTTSTSSGSAAVDCPVPECGSKFARRDVLASVSAIDVMTMDERERDRSLRTAFGDAVELRCVCGAVGVLQSRDDSRDVVPCPSCHRHYCTRCGQEAHPGRPCALDNDPNARRDEQKTKLWLRGNTKQCPNCREAVEKSEGCNHVTCRCGAQWCFICTGPFPNCHCGHFEIESKREAARLHQQEQDAAYAAALRFQQQGHHGGGVGSSSQHYGHHHGGSSYGHHGGSASDGGRRGGYNGASYHHNQQQRQQQRRHQAPRRRRSGGGRQQPAPPPRRPLGGGGGGYRLGSGSDDEGDY